MTRVAAVDCGTNSVRLLVADVDPAAGTLTDLERSMQIVRLGEGVDRTGRFAEAAIGRTTEALRGYSARIRELGAERVRMVATSATRDAANRAAFVARVVEVLGVEPEVISGTEEAGLSFSGAVRELGPGGAPYLVVDIGGGSTELVLGTPEGRVRASQSVDIGCVRLTERHLHDDPPSADQVTAAQTDIATALVTAARTVPLGEARTLVGVAGTVTTLTAMALDLPAYDPVAIHHARVPADQVHAAARRLVAMPREERAALRYMHPGRVDVIVAGALIWSAVVTAVGTADAVASEHDILDGIAWSMADGG